MLDYTDYDAVFGEASLPYNRRTIQAIEGRRKAMDGVLFIDRVLQALGIHDGQSRHSSSADSHLDHLVHLETVHANSR